MAKERVTVFQMDVNTAIEFWQRVIDRKANTEQERTDILIEMASEGKMDRVYTTGRSKQQIKKDLSKKFSILDVK